MLGLTRGMLTLIGVATAVALIWLAAQIGDDSTADYWALYGLIAAAGLGMAFSQLLGGWTKWGWPRLSGAVFLLGFLPALVVAGWVLGAGQPSENWLQQHVVDWSDDLGLDGIVEDLLDLAGPLAFLAGLTFGFTFDTTGPRTREVVEHERVDQTAVAPPPRERGDVRSDDEGVRSDREDVDGEDVRSDREDVRSEDVRSDREDVRSDREDVDEHDTPTEVVERPQSDPEPAPRSTDTTAR